jgi:CBS domain-containing protein
MVPLGSNIMINQVEFQDEGTLPESAHVGERESEPTEWPADLLRIAEQARTAPTPPRATVRTLLSWFGAQRRGSFIVWLIRKRLKELEIKTEPDFNRVWIDAEVLFVPRLPGEIDDDGTEITGASGPPETRSAMLEAGINAPIPTFVGGAIEDPTYRIGKLDAANKPVVSVSPNHPIKQAITLMLMHGFSQLPVMQGDREVKGILTWENIGARLSLGKTCIEARECMTPAQIISSEKSLFVAIEVIAQYQYVLVQAPDRRITGIVTSADLSRQFQQLTEPFLLLGEIEQHIRGLIVNRFTKDELKTVCDPADQERDIHDVADLTMGEYVRLLENPGNWERLSLNIDRGTFVEQLKSVKRIRNDIMHFDPDPLGPSDLQMLRQFVIFMQALRELS